MVQLIASNQLTLTNLNEKAIDRTEISFWHGLSATKYPLGVYDCSHRDHQYGNEFNVTSDKTYTVRVIAKQTKGSLGLRGGIWYTAMTSGNAWDGLANFTLVGEVSEDGLGVYERKFAVESGKTKARLYIQIEQEWDSSDQTTWRIYDGQVLDENGQPLVTDQNNFGALASPMATPNGTYIWKRTITYYTDGTSNTIWEYSGVGKDGVAGKDGIGIQTTNITYAISSSGTVTPTAGWTSQVPTLVNGQYLWTKTDWTYTDNSTKTGYSVTYISRDGTNGTNGTNGNGIKTTTITYTGSTSGITIPTSGWTSTIPTVAAGSYLWTKTVWTYTDNSSSTGYSVAMMGNTGPTGPSGVDGIPGKIIQQNAEPTNKFLDMLWQYTGTEPLNATGITVLSNIIYVWNGSAWQIWLLNPQNIQAVNAWVTNAMIGNAAIKLANIDTATITELSAVTAKLGDVEAGSITNDISYGFVAQGNHQYLGNSVINYRGINISEKVTLDNVLQYNQSMGFDAITGLYFQRTNENQDVISNIRLVEIGNNKMGLYVGDATEAATLTPKGLTLSSDVPWTTLSTTNGFSGGSIQFSVQNGVEYLAIAGLGVPQMNANQWYQATSLPAGSIAIPSINRVYPISGNNNAWDLLINPAGGIFIRCQAGVSATSNLVNGGCSFPIG